MRNVIADVLFSNIFKTKLNACTFIGLAVDFQFTTQVSCPFIHDSETQVFSSFTLNGLFVKALAVVFNQYQIISACLRILVSDSCTML